MLHIEFCKKSVHIYLLILTAAVKENRRPRNLRGASGARGEQQQRQRRSHGAAGSHRTPRPAPFPRRLRIGPPQTPAQHTNTNALSTQHTIRILLTHLY